jgi:hypothetical protein
MSIPRCANLFATVNRFNLKSLNAVDEFSSLVENEVLINTVEIEKYQCRG